jgi:hypothetical protein
LEIVLEVEGILGIPTNFRAVAQLGVLRIT